MRLTKEDKDLIKDLCIDRLNELSCLKYNRYIDNEKIDKDRERMLFIIENI